MIELLIEHGADINAEDGDGNTSLHLAIIHQAVCNTDLTEVGAFSLKRLIISAFCEDRCCETQCTTEQHGTASAYVHLALCLPKRAWMGKSGED